MNVVAEDSEMEIENEGVCVNNSINSGEGKETYVRTFEECAVVHTPLLTRLADEEMVGMDTTLRLHGIYPSKELLKETL
ncbi:unnamed protein product [Cuscuta epithymum]|uniref:Uncharacterized protein n=1 Tax=Cuscuta epithymum TaxID=186058 RepID=A0AAV0GH74_9ASTE|nr:unnamed protein product [Cuscuta epithymum]